MHARFLTIAVAALAIAGVAAAQPAKPADKVTVKVVLLTFLSPVSYFAFGTSAFSGPSPSGSTDCICA